MINELAEKNPHLMIHSIFDDAFSEYGCVIGKYDFVRLKQYAAEQLTVPLQGNSYLASVPELEQFKAYDEFSMEFFGNQPIQIGYSAGNSTSMNGMEYHKSSEIDIAITDYLIFVGKRQQITMQGFCTQDAKAFFVPANTTYEFYATTLHFAPCKVADTGFKQVVVLPKNTNASLTTTQRGTGEDQLLFGQNKWLMIHPEHPFMQQSQAARFLTGKNIPVKY